RPAASAWRSALATAVGAGPRSGRPRPSSARRGPVPRPAPRRGSSHQRTGRARTRGTTPTTPARSAPAVAATDHASAPRPADQGRLTVALATCNGARHLVEALRSILAQEGVPFDLLVSDDRSDDETLAVVDAEAGDRARVVVNTERLGLAGNWNRCVRLART